MNRLTLCTCAVLFAAGVRLPAADAQESTETEKKPPAKTEANEDLDIEISDEEALQDDILLVIDLPILVAEAREAGVEDEELVEVLQTAEQAGIGPGVVSAVLLAEIAATKQRGPRAELSLFFVQELAAGRTPSQIAGRVSKRPALDKRPSAAERRQVAKRFERMRSRYLERRTTLERKRAELLRAGRRRTVIGAAEHRRCIERLRKSAQAGADPTGDDARIGKAVALAARIGARPAKADKILADAGTSRDALEALVYQVSRPSKAARARTALARALR